MKGRIIMLGSMCAAIATVGGTAVAHPAPHAHASAASKATVRTWMRRTVEVGATNVHFRRISPRVVVPDGHGSTLTAAIGVRSITADGHGQLVFFFHGGHFLGWDSKYEIASIAKVEAAGPRRFDVTYVRYRAADPLCCPSRSPKTVRYRWTGSRIQPLAKRPRDPGTDPVEVRLSS
jgi:LppP/LprE lipoprotein